ncbi:hypothetical protein COV93_06965 [Candidatus Woesearchaeota archaeon CG11_big_fil_rev_8_21_14_0_20_43_8]|nr:MAG: hypothetical protein COV93_06965 [Candidatus Woesearchaeota archaeon CG11_big_fil_rev_8_21_14_0_20_43_8]PIO05415.1 MAG: hypothetical protein COT47_04900 [Candidatus Woesearchaeota archaeon CG08_land_8_20_14_0_20_43_7]
MGQPKDCLDDFCGEVVRLEITREEIETDQTVKGLFGGTLILYPAIAAMIGPESALMIAGLYLTYRSGRVFF